MAERLPEESVGEHELEALGPFGGPSSKAM